MENEFKINMVFNEEGEELENVISKILVELLEYKVF